MATYDTSIVGDRAAIAQGLAMASPEPAWGEWLLRETRMRLRKLSLGEASLLTIAIIGDSYTQDETRYCQALASTLQTTYGNAGPGWVGFGFYLPPSSAVWVNGGTQPGGIDGGVRKDITPDPIFSGTWASAYADSTTNAPSLSQVTSTTPGDYLDVPFPAGLTAVNLFYGGAAGTGVIKYSWDGGSAWSADTNLTGVSGASIALTGPPGSANTLRIQVVSGSVSLSGVDLQGATSGVRVHKLAASGSRSAQWAAVNSSKWRNQISTLAPKLCGVLLGTNDQGQTASPVTTAVFTQKIEVIFSSLRIVLPYSDMLSMMPAENQRTNNPYPMAEYTEAAKASAIQNARTFLDFQPHFGANAADYGWANADRQWYASDLIHPVPSTGGRVMADALLRLVTSQ